MSSALLPILLLVASGSLQVVQAFNGAVVFAPNTFRIGVEETVFIDLSQLNQDTDVTLSLHSPPPQNEQYVTKTVRVKKGEPLLTTLTLPASGKQLLSDVKNYMSGLQPATKPVTAVLKATARGKVYSKSPLVRVALNTGPVYLQLNKPIYSPGQEVKLRIVVTDNVLRITREAIVLEFVNPQNVIVYREKYSNFPESGILKVNYPLGSEPVLGIWTVSVNTGHEFFTSTNETFEVKEYVLPTFDATIEFTQRYILAETNVVEGKVIARYTFEEPVDGTVGLRVMLLPPGNGEPQKVCDEIRGPLANGEFQFVLNLAELRKTTPSQLLDSWFPGIVGSRLKLVAYVTESGTNSREIVSHDKTLFVTSPYVISFERSLLDFKPGYPYSVKIDVRHPNGDPSVGVPVAISDISMGAVGKQELPPGQVTDFRGSAIFTVAVPFKTSELWVTVVTKDRRYTEQGNARNVLKVYPHKPMAGPGVGYVWLQPRDAIVDVRVGSILTVDVSVHNPSKAPISVYYLVVAHGRVISWGRPTVDRETYLWVLNVEVKPEMSPFFRIIVYTIQHPPYQKGYFLADSIRVQVENKCPYNHNRELKLSLDKSSYAPKNKGILGILGEKDSYVGVMAVDQALYVLRNESILTRSKFFTEWEKTDIGRGPGGGSTVGEVLKNAGMVALFPGDQVIDYPDATVESRRRKRNIVDKCCDEAISTFDSKKCIMSEKFFKTYCVEDGCLDAFDKCCEIEGGTPILPKDTVCESLLVTRVRTGVAMDDEDFFMEPTAHDIRTNFPETWLYEDFQIGDATCPPGRDRQSCWLPIDAFPDSITSWNFHALAVSPTSGFCVAETIKTTVKKSLFVQLKLPYSAVRTETLELVATVFNYGGEQQRVLLNIDGVAGLCSEAKPGQKGPIHRLNVPQDGKVTHRFVVVPMRVGEFDVSVTARSMYGADVIIKKLRVVAEGRRTDVSSSQVLDPANKMQVRPTKADAKEFGKVIAVYPDQSRASVSWEVNPPEDAIPDTCNAKVSITGSILGPTLDTTLKGVDGFFQNAAGCAEQCMIWVAPTIYSALYLKYTGRLTVTMEDRVRVHLAQGYSFSLRYRKPNGGISVWAAANYHPTVWLTSYFMRVFCEMRHFVPAIQNSVIQSGLQWIASQQKPNGAFDGTIVGIYHVEMTGGLQGTDALTAFALTSFVACQDLTKTVPNVIPNARTYLEGRLEDIKTKPYILAMVTYVLALTNSTKAKTANEYLQKLATEDAAGNRYWVYDAAEIAAHGGKKPWVYVHKPHALNVEITAYALLAQVALNQMTYAGPIVAWLANQRSAKGSFVSTQDTAVTLEALAAYGKKAKEFEEGKTEVDVFVDDVLLNDRPLVFDKSTNNVMKEFEVPSGERVRIEAKGVFPVLTTMQIRYNRPGPSDEDDAYGIETDVREVMKRGTGKDFQRHLKEVYTCIEYRKNKKSGMVLVRFGIPTGYRVEQGQLRELRDNRALKIGNVELRDSSVIFYFDEIPSSPKRVCFNVRLVRTDFVRDLLPTKIEVTTYYEPEEVGNHFYQIESEDGEPVDQKCKNEICHCQKGTSPIHVDKQLHGELSQGGINELLKTMCDKDKYAYIVQIETVTNIEIQRRLTCKVVDVIHEVPEKAEDVLQKKREFYMPSKSETLNANSYYIVVGQKTEVVKSIRNVNSMRYILDESASIWDFPAKFLNEIDKQSPLHHVVQKLGSADCQS